MRLDTRQALRPVVCLPNPRRMQAARWIVTENNADRLSTGIYSHFRPGRRASSWFKTFATPRCGLRDQLPQHIRQYPAMQVVVNFNRRIDPQ